MQVFLSAVTAQFGACRDALASDLRTSGAEVKVQEDFQQGPGTLLQKLQDYVAQCDRVVALVGDAYGTAPQAAEAPGLPIRSYAQWEYLFALGERLDGPAAAPKPLFVYVASPAFLSANRVPQDPAAAAGQREFCDSILHSGKDHQQFETLDHLRVLVLRDRPSSPDVATPDGIRSYLQHLKADILTYSSPPWDPALYTELHGSLRESPRPAVFQNLLQKNVQEGRSIGAFLNELRSATRPLVIVGAPGSGKSVLLRQLALTLIDEAPAESSAPLIPVVVDLKFYSNDVAAEEFIRQHLATPGSEAYTSRLASSFPALLRDGRLALLLDGMDEMSGRGYTRRLEQLKQLTRAYPANRFVFTCRERDYDPAFGVEQWVIRELSDGQIEDLVERSCQFEQRPYPSELRVSGLAKRPDLLGAARNPFILRLLLTHYFQHYSFPAHLRELYESVIHHLFNRRGATEQAVTKCFRALEDIGLEITDCDELGVEISQDYVAHLEDVDEFSIRIGIESGILRQHGDALHFSHHRLQEYFAARAIERRFVKDPGVVFMYTDSVWADEIVTTLVAVSQQPNAILETLLGGRGVPAGPKARVRYLLLACRAMSATKHTVRRDLVHTGVGRLKRVVQRDDVPDRVKALRVLTLLDADAARPFVLDHSSGDASPWVRDVCEELIAANPPWWPEARALRRHLPRLPPDVRGRRTDWAPFRFLARALVSLAILVVAATLVFRGTYFTYTFPFVLALFMGAYPASYGLWCRLRYEGTLARHTGIRWFFRARLGLIVLLAGVSTGVGVVILRPARFLLVAALSFCVVWIADRFVLSLTLKRYNQQWLTLMQFVPVIAFAGICEFLGVFQLEDIPLLPIAMGVAGLVVFSVTTIGLTLDHLTRRWIERSVERNVDDQLVGALATIAETDAGTNVGFFNGMNAVVRRQAIRAVGHLRYNGDSMSRLLMIAEAEDSPYLRDAACQAIDEIQDRQRRDGHVEGLETSPRYPSRGDVGKERRFLLVTSVAFVLFYMVPVLMMALFAVQYARAGACFQRGFVLAQLGFDQSAVRWYDGCVARDASALALNHLSWLLATSRDDRVRDPSRAVALGELAVKAAGGNEPNTIDTLAEAYVQAGMRQRARELSGRARLLAPRSRYFEARHRKMNE